MDSSTKFLQSIRLKGRVSHDRKLEIVDSLDKLPEGEVEVILIYHQSPIHKKIERLSPSKWPSVNGGRYLGGKLRREDIYDDGR
jgi:hypothetical protein